MEDDLKSTQEGLLDESKLYIWAKMDKFESLASRRKFHTQVRPITEADLTGLFIVN